MELSYREGNAFYEKRLFHYICIPFTSIWVLILYWILNIIVWEPDKNSHTLPFNFKTCSLQKISSSCQFSCEKCDSVGSDDGYHKSFNMIFLRVMKAVSVKCINLISAQAKYFAKFHTIKNVHFGGKQK